MDAPQPVVAELLHTLHSGKQEHQCAHNDIKETPSLPLPVSTPLLSRCPNFSLCKECGGTMEGFQVQ